MHEQLARLLDEYKSALQRVHALRSGVPDARWGERADPGRWSVAECVAHLNLTSEAFLPPLQAAITAARNLGPAGNRKYRRDPAGWMLSVLMPPPVRLRVPAPAAFIAGSLALPSELISEFERHQAAFVACVQAADTWPVDRVRVQSPFTERFKYNAWSALVIIPRHQHRHLWQAEQVWQHLEQQGAR